MKHPSRELSNSSGQVTPSPSKAISAFIKSLRLRRAHDAVFWAAFLWQDSNGRARVQRRLLYGSAEDNLSVSVIECISDWYSSPRKRSFDAATEEILRLCATKNWWAQRDGWWYIFAWRRVEMDRPDYRNLSLDELYETLHSAIIDRDSARGLSAFNAVYERREFRPKPFAEQLTQWASLYGGEQSKRLAAVYAKHASAFWLDGNMSGQTYYALLHGDFGENASPKIGSDQVQAAIANATDRLLSGPIEVPSYALDGVHAGGGSEKRFAGLLKYMAGCCKAYQHYGRLSPEDLWLPSFFDLPNP